MCVDSTPRLSHCSSIILQNHMLTHCCLSIIDSESLHVVPAQAPWKLICPLSFHLPALLSNPPPPHFLTTLSLTLLPQSFRILSVSLALFLPQYKKILNCQVCGNRASFQHTSGCLHFPQLQSNQSIKFYLYSPYSQTTVCLIGL